MFKLIERKKIDDEFNKMGIVRKYQPNTSIIFKLKFRTI